MELYSVYLYIADQINILFLLCGIIARKVIICCENILFLCWFKKSNGYAFFQLKFEK